MTNELENLSPELKDILEMIHRYNASHKEGCFLYSFVGFKKDPEHKCIDCGNDNDIIDDNKSRIGAYGDLYVLRNLLEELRNLIEDEHEEGFVNV